MLEVSEDIEKAAYFIQKGKLVLFPTETVYGLGASSWNRNSCLKIYEVKKRPKDNPFIIHVGRVEDIFELGIINPKYEAFIYKFSPGPISFIVEKRKENLFSSNLPTIGIRVPSIFKIQDFLKLAGPVSAPSANLSGKPSITKREYLFETFQNTVDFLLLGEEPEIGIESTVIDISKDIPILLRPGKISSEEIKKILPDLQVISKKFLTPMSPGIKYKHYAPDCLVKWYEGEKLSILENSYLGFSNIPSAYSIQVKDNLEYMKNLYSFFIESDKRKVKVAYCEKPIPDFFSESLINRIEKAILK